MPVIEEVLIGLVYLFVLGLFLAAWVLGVIAFVRSFGLKRELKRLRGLLQAMESRLGEAPAPGPARPPERAAQVPPVPPPAPAAPPKAPVAPIPASPPAPPPKPAVAAPGEGGLESLESKIAKRWLPWVGGVVLFLSAAFLLKHAFENKWIGPTGQVVLCAVAGAAILALGACFAAKGWRILAQCLMGLGVAILYVVFFAAFSWYEPPVMSQTLAFAFMVAVTVAGMSLAVLHGAVSLAFMAVLGGLLTPVLLSTGVDARDTLFTYLLVLNLGVLGVSLFRGWRALDALAMAGTFVLYGAWYAKFYQPEALAPALAWLGAFYAIFLLLPFVFHLLRKRTVPIERFVMALANAGFVFTLAWLMLYEDYRHALGFVALGMAAAYLVLGTLLRRRLPADARSLFGSTALAVAFLTMAVPLHLRTHGITLAWAVEAPVLLYLGYRFRYGAVRVFAAVVLAIAIGRLFQAHWPLHQARYVPFANRYFLSAIVVPAAAAVFAVIHELLRKAGALYDRVLKIVAALAASLLALVIVHAELCGWLREAYTDYYADCARVALWSLAAAGYLVAGIRWRSSPAWSVGAFVTLVGLLLGAVAFERSMAGDHLLALNWRFGACLLAVLVVFAYAAAVFRGQAAEARIFAGLFFWTGLVVLLALLSAEAHSFCLDMAPAEDAPRAARMAITLVWGLYAAALLAAGFWRRRRALRFAALGLFGLSALKLVALDIAGIKDVYRIIAFLVVGLLIVVASYLYHKLETRVFGPLMRRSDARQSPAPPGTAEEKP